MTLACHIRNENSVLTTHWSATCSRCSSGNTFWNYNKQNLDGDYTYSNLDRVYIWSYTFGMLDRFKVLGDIQYANWKTYERKCLQYLGTSVSKIYMAVFGRKTPLRIIINTINSCIAKSKIKTKNMG